MFLKIVNNNWGYMNSTTIYEMDNIEYFSLPLWQVTSNSWEDLINERKQYAQNVWYMRERYPNELNFVHQMIPLANWEARDQTVTRNNGGAVTTIYGQQSFDELGVKKLIDWAYALQPHWFHSSSSHINQTPVLLYVDRDPIQLYDHDLYHMPYIFFIKLIHKEPKKDKIIITNMPKIYLQSDEGKNIETLYKKIDLCKENKEKELELRKNYFTKEYFEYKHTNLYNSIEQSLRKNYLFHSFSQEEQEEIEKIHQERKKILDPYWKTVEEINNKYNSHFPEDREFFKKTK